jgi:hypothetical protein
MAQKLQATELDFEDIKSNLKTYMKNQTEFSDYNFEGSGLSTLIDLLAYNTHYLAMNANMALNEAFLDSASLRSSVVSHAKTLGYTPRSARAPVAYLDVVINESGVNTATINKGTKFTSQVDGTSYSFVTNDTYTATAQDSIVRFSNLPVYEGSLVTAKYTVDNNNIDKRYIITDNRADTSTLRVRVQTSSTDSTTRTYALATDITQSGSSAEVYFIQEVEDGKFEVYFGDGVIGKKPDDGNIIILEYIVTNKEKANGASRFSGTTVGGYTNFTISTLVQAGGGAEPESIQSIKYNAPLDFASQGRAVTTDDYKLLVPQVYPATKAVQVWGGEDNDPPRYGQVYISIKTNSGVNLTANQKNTVEGLLSKYNIASIRPTIVDPEVTKVILTTTVKYDAKNTTKLSNEIETDVRNAMTTYNNSDLQNFDGIFRFSKLSRVIDAADPSILSNITSLKIEKEFTPRLNTFAQYILTFSNRFYNPHDDHTPIVSSTGFKVYNNDNTLYFDDFAGKLRTYYLVGGTTRTYVDEDAGIVDYVKGEITVTSLNISETSNADGTIHIQVIPNSNDIVPVRNQLVEIDLVETKITAEVDTITSGGSSAGTNYTTSASFQG